MVGVGVSVGVGVMVGVSVAVAVGVSVSVAVAVAVAVSVGIWVAVSVAGASSGTIVALGVGEAPKPSNSPPPSAKNATAIPEMINAIGREDVAESAALLLGFGVGFVLNFTPAFSSSETVMTFSTLVRGSLALISRIVPCVS